MSDHPLFSQSLPESETFKTHPSWMALAVIAGESIAGDSSLTSRTDRPQRRKHRQNRAHPYRVESTSINLHNSNGLGKHTLTGPTKTPLITETSEFVPLETVELPTPTQFDEREQHCSNEALQIHKSHETLREWKVKDCQHSKEDESNDDSNEDTLIEMGELYVRLHQLNPS